jgi:hypothetical protein
VAVPELWYDFMPFSPIGHLKVILQNKHYILKSFNKPFLIQLSPNDKEVKYTRGCAEMITHTNFESKKSVTFHWTAPKSGSGCISFKYN